MIFVPIDLIIFDCDGVILDSVNIKTNTFAMLFSQHGEDFVKEVVDYHLANGGVSRYEKFKYYYTELLGQDLDSTKMLELDNSFNEISFQSILQTPFISGAIQFIRQNYRKWSLYVASGAPERELLEIFDKRGLLKYFKGVYGSPTSKKNLVAKIVKDNQVDPESVLMIGDSDTDEEAASFVGTRFLGVGSSWPYNDSLIDLVELESYIYNLSLD